MQRSPVIDTVAIHSSLPLALPLQRVEAASWVRQLTPSTSNPDGTSWTVEPASPLPLLERLAKLVGRPPVEWAVQLGDHIARGIHRRYPHWATTEAEHRANRVVAERMALVSLEFLATGRFPSGKVAAAVTETMQRRGARAIPLKEFLQTCADTHADLARDYLRACEHLVRTDQQLRAAEAVSTVLLACAREYTESIVSHQASASLDLPVRRQADPALRRQLVEELLRSDPRRKADADLADIGKRIGYPVADHRHRALVVWQGPDAAGGAESLPDFIAELVARAGPAPVLVVDRPDIGASWVWWHLDSSADRADIALPPSLRAATASTGRGLGGFRHSHARAMEVRAAAGSIIVPTDRAVDYDSLSGVLPFVEDLPRAAAFVVDELGRLASPSGGGDAQRLTLATLLRTQSVSATARELFVTRSTVTYRLQRAESLLPARWRERPMEVALALRLLDVLGADAIFGALPASRS